MKRNIKIQSKITKIFSKEQIIYIKLLEEFLVSKNMHSTSANAAFLIF